MRFPFASQAASMDRPVREIERANRIVSVRAPEGWPDVQVEAWLDWADAEGLSWESDDGIVEITLSWARRFDPAKAEALAGTMLLGLATPSRSTQISASLIDLSEPDASRTGD
jgi:ribonucleoside-diphosphate reductase alpha chain